MTDFEPHGGTSLEVEGRILRFHPLGHQNAEEIERLRRDTLHAVSAFAGRPWGVLYVADSALLTPDAAVSSKAVTWNMVGVGLSAIAIVISGVAAAALQEAQLRQMLLGISIPVEVFDNEANAVQWLRQAIDSRTQQG
jgi:hypothetical protein